MCVLNGGAKSSENPALLSWQGIPSRLIGSWFGAVVGGFCRWFGLSESQIPEADLVREFGTPHLITLRSRRGGVLWPGYGGSESGRGGAHPSTMPADLHH